MTRISWARHSALMGSALAMVLTVSAPAAAQVDARLERIETQIRALQRSVFPGGDERFFEPEITPQTNTVTRQPAVSTSALTDVLARLEAIESQLARLTASTEVNDNALSALEMRVNAMEAAASAPPSTAITSGTSASSAGSTRPTGAIAVPDDDPVELVLDNGSPAAVGPSPERLEGVQAIAKPATGDAGDDEYTYGFRLWDAGFFPEAQQQLALFVEQYPNHWRTTYGRNLLGRAFLDAGEPRRAATHFFDNYQADKQAERAPDSLLYLAQSMIELGDTRRACIALAEFGETYPALAVGRLQSIYGGLGGRVDCDG